MTPSKKLKFIGVDADQLVLRHDADGVHHPSDPKKNTHITVGGDTAPLSALKAVYGKGLCPAALLSRRKGIDRLRGIIVSHPHMDHYGGIGAVLDELPVDSLYIAAASWNHSVYQSWRQQHPQVPQRGLALGHVVSMAEETQALVLWPPDSDTLRSGANGVSVSLWVRSRSGPALLCMGDLEEDGEAALLAVWEDSLRSAAAEFLILKAGHHGSKTSSSVGSGSCVYDLPFVIHTHTPTP